MYFENLASDVLDDEIINDIKAQGLTPVVVVDDYCEDFREGLDTTWVGVDVSTRLDVVDKGNCFEDYVADYCKQILDCTINDIIWATVYKYEHSGVCYNLTGFSCPWDSGIDGFIYMTKEQARKIYGVKRISSKLHDKIQNTFEKEVENYSTAINSSFYSVSLDNEADEEEEFFWYGGCLTKEQMIEAFNDMLLSKGYKAIGKQEEYS